MGFFDAEVSTNDNSVPESRVSVFATNELNEYLAENPLVIEKAAGVSWKVSQEGDKYIAEGTISVPLKLIFKEGNLRNDVVYDDLVFIDVQVDGESKMGIRFEKPKKETFDPLASVNIPSTIAQAQKEHWS